jgi:hypothetical protein
MKSPITSLAKATCITGSLFLGLASSLLAAPPSNDNFANAALLSLNTLTSVNNTEATNEAGETGHRRFGELARKSVWYRLTPDFNGYIELDTTGSADDTVVAVYKGTKLAKLTCLGRCDDMPDTYRAKLRIAVVKGVSYFIALDGLDGGGVQQIIAKALLRHQSATFEADTRFTSGFTSPYKDDHGKLTLVLTDKGSVSGKVLAGNKKYSFKSAISADKVIPIIIPRPEQLPIFLTVTLDTLADGQMKASAAVTGNMGDKALLATTAYQAPKFSTLTPCPRRGNYNYHLPTITHTGHGFGRLSISNTGICKGTGFLGDGTSFTYSARVLNDGGGDVILDLAGKGRIVYHLPLYGGKGQIGGRVSLSFVNESSTTLSGSSQWFRPPFAGVFIPLGLEQYNMAMAGKNYTPPGPNTRVDTVFNTNGGSARFQAISAGLTHIHQLFTLSTANTFQFVANNPNAVTLRLNAKTGIVTGSARFTDQTKTSPIRAMLIPTGTPGVSPGIFGYNLRPERGGIVNITPNP